MRYFKDSSSEHNYRVRFWDSMTVSQKFHRLYPFSFARLHLTLYPGVYHYHNLLNTGPFLWKSLYKYMPSRHFFQHYQSVKVFVFSVLMSSVFYHFESRLWKERKWDKEPGQTIPLRNRLFFRVVNDLVHMKILPVLYYTGAWVQEEDLNMQVDIDQISLGRKYRRFLCMQYARKMNYSVHRNSAYDFLEISENYAKD